MSSMVAATPNPDSDPSSTRTMEARQHAHRRSPPASSGGRMRTISIFEPGCIADFVYKKTPLELRSRVVALISAPPMPVFKATGTLTGMRDELRRSGFALSIRDGEPITCRCNSRSTKEWDGLCGSRHYSCGRLARAAGTTRACSMVGTFMLRRRASTACISSKAPSSEYACESNAIE